MITGTMTVADLVEHLLKLDQSLPILLGPNTECDENLYGCLTGVAVDEIPIRFIYGLSGIPISKKSVRALVIP